MSECWTKSADAPKREHYGLAVSCAKRFAGRGVPMEELVSEAEAALLWAASRFDPARGARFSTYAVPVVLGALRDLCRRAGPMHVPRAEMRVLTLAAQARERLLQQNGQEPTLADLAREVNVEETLLGEMLCAQERMRSAGGDAQGLAPCTPGFEDWVLLKDAIQRLPAPYAQILWLRHGLGLSQTDLARRFGVSQSRVSRWEERGRELLGAALNPSSS